MTCSGLALRRAPWCGVARRLGGGGLICGAGARHLLARTAARCSTAKRTSVPRRSGCGTSTSARWCSRRVSRHIVLAPSSSGWAVLSRARVVWPLGTGAHHLGESPSFRASSDDARDSKLSARGIFPCGEYSPFSSWPRASAHGGVWDSAPLYSPGGETALIWRSMAHDNKRGSGATEFEWDVGR